MLHRSTLAAALVLALAIAACGGSDPGPPPQTACHYGGRCYEFEGYLLDVSATNDGCTQDGGTAMPSCPAEGLLGVCTRDMGDGIALRGYYYDPSTVGPMQSSCAAEGGTWTTP
ncbi:MAG TPA: hypothetical protein VLS93_18840 [Anaeromyxobacteraceae bacterium]|nr:hypothetical protein [Anaeromyxobacteraceae bacterium]